MKKEVSRATAAALCVLTAALSVNVTYAVLLRRQEAQFPNYEANHAMFGKLAEIREKVADYYVGEYNAQDALDMACTGYMMGVGDRWSGYLSKKEYEDATLSLHGKSVGIGVYFLYSQTENTMRAIEVYRGSPAEAAGVRANDLLLGANGKTLAEDGYEAVYNTVLGEEGEPVEITYQSAATGQTHTVSMVRREVETTMVSGKMLDAQTEYLRIYNFREHSEAQFETVLNDLLAQGAERLIFDVRNDPGGSVDSLCKMLDPLLPEGTIMTLDSKAGKEQVYESDADALNLPMAVIVNAESISAAEFFAAALQEYGKAVVVGEQTIGKGYSQRLYPLSDGSALRLSDNTYYTPQGKSLIGVGVVPDEVVPMDETDRQTFYFLAPEEDVQLAAARAALDKIGSEK